MFCLQVRTFLRINHRVIFNGFAKIGWAVALSWLILACVKQRGGLVDNILSWSGWVPLARVQYCVYLLHRTIVYIVNSYVTTTVRYSNLHLTQQFLRTAHRPTLISISNEKCKLFLMFIYISLYLCMFYLCF